VESDALALGAFWDFKTGSAELMPQSTLTKIATNPAVQAVKTGQFIMPSRNIRS
jgi:predicted MFS family arabinose efflux permease